MAIAAAKKPLSFYVDMLNRGVPFTFVRYGDGEWSTIMQDRTITSSHSQVLTDKRLQTLMMRSIIRRPMVNTYILACRPGSARAGIEEWLHKNAPGIQWHDERVFYSHSRHGRLFPYVDAVRRLDVPRVIIGPERLRRLNGKVFPMDGFVRIPDRNCWEEFDRILNEAAGMPQPCYYTISAGPAGKILAWRLYAETQGKCWILDHGSLWDPYVGIKTRRYHRYLLNDPALIRANLGEA